MCLDIRRQIFSRLELCLENAYLGNICLDSKHV